MTIQTFLKKWTRTRVQRAGTARVGSALMVSVLALPALLGAKGCDVGQIGSDSIACGARAGDTCATNEFCSFDKAAMCGQADATGLCKFRPEGCREIYAPACGCDGETYENECQANSSGSGVLHTGKCDAGGGSSGDCGGIAGLSCAEGEFCNFPSDAICGAADQMGKCEARPVCGCDDVTYSNECDAHAKGISVLKDGPCEVILGTECKENAQCGKGEYCEFGSKCGGIGSCKAAPETCPTISDPVCGCDGKTYGNDCEAAGTGVSVASAGECAPVPSDTCGGLLGLKCGAGEYCYFKEGDFCGAADATGTCMPVGKPCDSTAGSVCGCDGRTYGSQCEASKLGMSVATSGACEPAPSTCKQNIDCGSGNYCDRGAKCYDVPEGVCRPMPTGCSKDLKPVCSCDMKEYSNACEAARAGASVATNGECGSVEPDPNLCGGIQGIGCDKGEFCFFPMSAACGAGDQTGSCNTIVDPASCKDVTDPVCGCDGKTYQNECLARVAGVSAAHIGECELSVLNCGGIQGLGCANGEFCDFAKDAMCGNGDMMGTCQTIPEACTAHVDPVCGCDYQTYSNACEANSKGVSVVYAGECIPSPDSCLASSDCKSGEFCEIPGCLAGEKGQCAPLPTACEPPSGKPVCSCEGLTYPSQCEAQSKGLRIRDYIACEDIVQPVACKSSGECGAGTFCDFDGHCEGDGFAGTCAPIPTACKAYELQTERCGCDGKIYAEKCFADMAGVSSTFDFAGCAAE
jgi:hypothetical protein